MVELSYVDIYGKKYKNIFDLKLDDKEREMIECEEKFIEINKL